METKTFAQQAILEMVERKNQTRNSQDHWIEYSETYNDYNDCHGDYYDAE
jgi:hypothetical protein